MERRNAEAKSAHAIAKLEQEIAHAAESVQMASDHHLKLHKSAAELESMLQRSRKVSPWLAILLLAHRHCCL